TYVNRSEALSAHVNNTLEDNRVGKRRKNGGKLTADLDAAEQAAGVDDAESETAERDGQAQAECCDENQAEADLALRDGAEQDDKRGGAGDEPGRGAHADQPTPGQVPGSVRMRAAAMGMDVPMRIRAV